LGREGTKYFIIANDLRVGKWKNDKEERY